MNKIYHISPLYLLVKKYMLFCFRHYYREVIIHGEENLPDNNSAVIFAPNHLNALMDALSVLLLTKHDKTVVFLAKADLFNSRFAASLMRFAKILPAYRMENGIENLGKNNDIFEQCIEVLESGQAIGVMPEGGQGEQHRIRPLVKGVFRIAFEAQKRFGINKSVKIVPVGIDMGDLIKQGKHLIINIGKPIDVQQYMEDYETAPSSMINKAKLELRKSLSNLTRDIASLDNYNVIHFISEKQGYEFVSEASDKQPDFSRFLHKRQVIIELLRTEKENLPEFERIKANAAKLQEELKRLKLHPAVFTVEKASIAELILGFPFFVFGFLTNFLPAFVPVWVRRLLKVEYDGFYSSVHFVVGLFTFPLFYTLQTVLAARLFSFDVVEAGVFFIAQFFTRSAALKWWSNVRKLIAKQKYRESMASD